MNAHRPRGRAPGTGRDRPTDRAARGDDRCAAALHAYLDAVVGALARRCIGVVAVHVHATEPHLALSGRIELDPASARPGLGWGPVTADWHEERGWSAELRGGSDLGLARRYLPMTVPGNVVPYPTLVADFLAGLARGEDLGSIAPDEHRHRPPAGQRDLPTRLGAHGAARRLVGRRG